MGWGEALSILGWFSPERRDKAKRIKLDRLEKEQNELLDKRENMTERESKRLAKVIEEIDKLNKNLGG